MITATYKDHIVATANESEIVRIEGNVYFPPDSIKKEFSLQVTYIQRVIGKVKRVTIMSWMKADMILPGIIQLQWKVRQQESVKILQTL